jgi:glutaredoxin
MRRELYGAPGCPHTAELREQLEWDGVEFEEYDVEGDAAAFSRLLDLSGGQQRVPVLVEDGQVVQVGWQGRACIATAPPGASSSPSPQADGAAVAAGGDDT